MVDLLTCGSCGKPISIVNGQQVQSDGYNVFHVGCLAPVYTLFDRRGHRSGRKDNG